MITGYVQQTPLATTVELFVALVLPRAGMSLNMSSLNYQRCGADHQFETVRRAWIQFRQSCVTKTGGRYRAARGYGPMGGKLMTHERCATSDEKLVRSCGRGCGDAWTMSSPYMLTFIMDHQTWWSSQAGFAYMLRSA